MKTKCLQSGLFMITSLCAMIGNAAPVPFPSGCIDTPLNRAEPKFELYGSKKSQPVYLFYNKGQESLQLTYHNQKHPNLGQWQQVLGSKRWSSFTADMPVTFSCQVTAHNSTKAINCRNYLAICGYQRAKVPVHMYGSYFIIQNQYSKYLVVRDTIQEGVLLR